MSSASGSSGSTATSMRCWPSSSPPAPPVTPASAPASTTGSSSRRPRTRRSGCSSARSRRGARSARRGATRRSSWPTPRGSATRSARKPTRPPAPRPASPTSGWRRRRPTCSTTSRSCSHRGGCRWRTPSRSSMAVAADPAELEIAPSLDEVRELACEHTLIPLRHSFIDDCETPVSAFLKLREEGPAFLLESADQGQRVGRYSFIGFRPREVIRWSLGDDGDPYEIAAAAVARHRQAPLDDLPPFAGGAVGVFGYDLVRTVEPLGEPNPDPVGVPDLALMLTDVLVVFDHLKHTVSILVNVYAEDGELEAAYADALATIAKARR